MEEIFSRPNLVVLVRHGESLRNRAKQGNIYLPDKDTADLVRGFADSQVPLIQRGEDQAIQTGIALREKFGIFDAVYDSGYKRTRETRGLAMQSYSDTEHTQMKFRESYLLRERDSGYTHCMTTEEADHHFPYLREHFEREGYFYARPPGGESQADTCKRVYDFNNILFRHRAGKKVLIFTHGGTIRAFRFNLENWSADEYMEHMPEKPENCGVTVYRFNSVSGQLELQTFNEVYWEF